MHVGDKIREIIEGLFMASSKGPCISRVILLVCVIPRRTERKYR